MRVYISGKISGLPIDEVEKKFWETESKLFSLGLTPVNPLKNGIVRNSSWEEHLSRDLEILKTCDAILLLPDWMDSDGAKIEKEESERLGLIQMSLPNNTSHLELFNAIHKATGITQEDITGNSRERHLVDVRTIFAYKLRGGYPLCELSRIMRKNHATVSYYFERYNEQMRYRDFRELVRNIEEKLCNEY